MTSSQGWELYLSSNVYLQLGVFVIWSGLLGILLFFLWEFVPSVAFEPAIYRANLT
jgi:hypothetical protein